MRIERLDFADNETMLACHQVYLAAHDSDLPDDPWFAAQAFSGWMRMGWNAEPREIWTARAPDGNGAVDMNCHFDAIALACQMFIHGIVQHLAHAMMQRAFICAANIHAGLFAHGLQSLKLGQL